MLFYPDAYLKNVQEITIEFLNKNKIKALILDVDNTLIDYNRVMAEGTKQWCENLKKQGIKIYILSNSNKEEKIKKIAKELEVEYSFFGMKPLKKGFKKAIGYLGERPENIAEVGDQIFTDVLGAKICKLFSILVEPIAEQDILLTKLKRPLENFVIKGYLRKTKEEK